jgi:hypothetical protein
VSQQFCQRQQVQCCLSIQSDWLWQSQKIVAFWKVFKVAQHCLDGLPGRLLAGPCNAPYGLEALLAAPRYSAA